MQWVPAVAAIWAMGLPILGVLWRIMKKVSQTNQYFDPSSPVARAVGTVPDRIKKNEKAIQGIVVRVEDHETRISSLEAPESSGL